MLKWFNKKKKDNKGFTLVELVIVVAILAILVGLLAPQYTKYVEKSRKAADVSNIDSLVTAVKVAAADQDYADIIPETDTTVTITMTSSGTTVLYGTSEDIESASSDGGKALKSAFTEYAGDEWAETALKSKSWKSSDTENNPKIIATCTIKATGSVEVSYDPANVKGSETEATDPS